MCADAGFHADQARRDIGEPRFHLATRPLLPQHDGAARIVADYVERVFADIDANHGDCAFELLGHGVLLVFGAPSQHSMLVGREHGRTIPLTDSVDYRTAAFLARPLGRSSPASSFLCSSVRILRRRGAANSMKLRNLRGTRPCPAWIKCTGIGSGSKSVSTIRSNPCSTAFVI